MGHHRLQDVYYDYAARGSDTQAHSFTNVTVARQHPQLFHWLLWFSSEKNDQIILISNVVDINLGIFAHNK